MPSAAPIATAGATSVTSNRHATTCRPRLKSQLDSTRLSGTNAGSRTSSGTNFAPMLAARTVPPKPMAPSVANAARATTPRMTSVPGSSRSPLMTQGAGRLEQRLYRAVRGTCEEYNLLSPGDRILVAMSGGKDSYTLFHLLGQLIPRLPVKVEMVAVHLDQVQPNYDGSGLRAYLDASGWPYEILREDTYSVVTEHLDDKSTYCSLCSRLRRGILYTAAERLGCNKLALGHHRDDSLETFLLNLFYSGKLQALPASYRTDDGRFEVIRPLIECGEAEIAAFAASLAFPIIPCNLCGSQEGLKREAMS